MRIRDRDLVSLMGAALAHRAPLGLQLVEGLVGVVGLCLSC